MKGRKRHILVDHLGYLLVAVVTAANVSEGAGLHLGVFDARLDALDISEDQVRELLDRADRLNLKLSILFLFRYSIITRNIA